MRSILPLLLAMTITAASGPVSPVEGQEMEIGDARRLPLGEVVTIKGYVSVASGIIDAGFALWDGNGGIYVDADSSAAGRMIQPAAAVTGAGAEGERAPPQCAKPRLPSKE